MRAHESAGLPDGRAAAALQSNDGAACGTGALVFHAARARSSRASMGSRGRVAATSGRVGVTSCCLSGCCLSPWPCPSGPGAAGGSIRSPSLHSLPASHLARWRAAQPLQRRLTSCSARPAARARATNDLAVASFGPAAAASRGKGWLICHFTNVPAHYSRSRPIVPILLPSPPCRHRTDGRHSPGGPRARGYGRRGRSSMMMTGDAASLAWGLATTGHVALLPPK